MGNQISWDVALVVLSGKYSLAELTARLERKPQSGSHDKGTPRLKHGTWDRTIWRQNACNPNAPLREQCWKLLADIPPKCSDLVAANPDDVSVLFDVAGYFETAYFNVGLPPELIRELSVRGFGLEVTGYPCVSEEEITKRGSGSGGTPRTK